MKRQINVSRSGNHDQLNLWLKFCYSCFYIVSLRLLVLFFIKGIENISTHLAFKNTKTVIIKINEKLPLFHKRGVQINAGFARPSLNKHPGV